MKITNVPDANKYLYREYRKGGEREGCYKAEACSTMDHNVESPGTGMLRRELLAMLSAYAARAVGRARNTASLEPFFESREGAAILLDVRSRRPIAIHAAAVAGRFLAPPGSTLKPFVLAALLRSGKLTATESLPCPGRLTIAGRSFDCSHPRLDSPMRVETALAYSCNCFVARVAERFAPGELAGEFARAGFGEASGRIRPVSSRDAVRLQALGEEGILITAAELAMAYRSLALQAGYTSNGVLADPTAGSYLNRRELLKQAGVAALVSAMGPAGRVSR